MTPILNHLGSIWYCSGALEVFYSPNQFLGLDFFDVSYSKPALTKGYCIEVLLLHFGLMSNEFSLIVFNVPFSGQIMEMLSKNTTSIFNFMKIQKFLPHTLNIPSPVIL